MLERGFTTLQPGNSIVSVNLRTLSAFGKVNLFKTGLLFALVGVKTQGVRDLLFNKTVQLKRNHIELSKAFQQYYMA